MVFRHLTDEELVNHVLTDVLSEDSDQITIHTALLNELVDRFEKVLMSDVSRYDEAENSKNPNQLELF